MDEALAMAVVLYTPWSHRVIVVNGIPPWNALWTWPDERWTPRPGASEHVPDAARTHHSVARANSCLQESGRQVRAELPSGQKKKKPQTASDPKRWPGDRVCGAEPSDLGSELPAVPAPLGRARGGRVGPPWIRHEGIRSIQSKGVCNEWVQSYTQSYIYYSHYQHHLAKGGEIRSPRPDVLGTKISCYILQMLIFVEGQRKEWKIHCILYLIFYGFFIHIFITIY